NIQDEDIANHIIYELSYHLPTSTINFDLNDCDCILRIEHGENIIEKVNQVFEKLGHYCEILID
ncbi:MAG: hypothetical protein JNM51_11895, partial [Bacteroidia bacterium]|nr:hypothetical protein [Bacteroidia bacterium]